MSSNIGLSKHRKSGKVHNQNHFTGKTGGKRIRRKGLTRKQRRLNRGTHINKFTDAEALNNGY